ncbi:MAG: OmpA family protein [Acetobacteraceae bacterium]|nr:OmpA family protein [Acetobacteraceae bacterium]
MTRKPVAAYAAIALLALTLAACASLMGQSKLDQVADQLKSALAGEPVDVTKEKGQIKLTSSADYLYPSGGYRLRPGTPVLSKMVPILASLHNTKIVVSGYTDNTPVGPQLQRMGISNNIDLSSKRAGEVVTYFRSQGVDPNLLSAQGFGDTNPLASNDTPEGRAKNRRVEITLVGDGT